MRIHSFFFKKIDKAQNVLTLFICSMKHYYLLAAKNTPSINNSILLRILWIKDILILLLRSTKLYPDGTSVYITKDDFDGAQVIPL